MPVHLHVQVSSVNDRERFFSYVKALFLPICPSHELIPVEEVFAIRWFLGIFEAAMLPGVLFYLSTFYKRNELASRLGVFYGNDVPLEFVTCSSHSFLFLQLCLRFRALSQVSKLCSKPSQ
jgi:hypothetical protein